MVEWILLTSTLPSLENKGSVKEDMDDGDSEGFGAEDSEEDCGQLN